MCTVMSLLIRLVNIVIKYHYKILPHYIEIYMQYSSAYQRELLPITFTWKTYFHQKLVYCITSGTKYQYGRSKLKKKSEKLWICPLNYLISLKCLPFGTCQLITVLKVYIWYGVVCLNKRRQLSLMRGKYFMMVIIGKV